MFQNHSSPSEFQILLKLSRLFEPPRLPKSIQAYPASKLLQLPYNSYLLPRSAANSDTHHLKQRIVVFHFIPSYSLHQNTILRVYEPQNPPEKFPPPVFILDLPLIIHGILNVAPHKDIDLKQLCPRHSSSNFCLHIFISISSQ